MSRFLLDSNHASALLNEREPFVSRILNAGLDSRFLLCTPVAGELYFMMFNSTRIGENLVRLERRLESFPILPYDLPAARRFGQIRADLRRLGRPIPPTDIQIAAISLLYDLTLLTADRHFAHVPGLRVENWLA